MSYGFSGAPSPKSMARSKYNRSAQSKRRESVKNISPKHAQGRAKSVSPKEFDAIEKKAPPVMVQKNPFIGDVKVVKVKVPA